MRGPLCRSAGICAGCAQRDTCRLLATGVCHGEALALTALGDLFRRRAPHPR